jgi:Cu(I)/Ag(I) efflux system membrane fusion protein
MFAHVEVHGQGVGACEVPSSSVLARRDQFFVFVRPTDGTFVEREVRIGEQHGDRITVLSNLSPGEMVVSEGAILLDAEANEAL